jgi:hypothetical protein
MSATFRVPDRLHRSGPARFNPVDSDHFVNLQKPAVDQSPNRMFL